MAKTIENKTVKISDGINPMVDVTYGELILTAVKAPSVINGQQQPLDYDGLKKIQRVDNVVGTDKVQKEYVFEDADYDFIKEKVTKMNWAFYHEEFINFTDCINGVK